LFFFPLLLQAQSSNYWGRNFNEESSLVSGAVVGGGAGPSAIFYNPAGIAEIEESKLSINASLFSFDYFKGENAWGNEIDFISTRFIVVPRFISFMLKPKKNPNWSLEIAFLNNENYQLENAGSVDKPMDVLKYLPGDERYNVYYHYNNNFRDDWFGAGGSYKINSNLYFGTSMFFSVRQLDYSYLVDIEAGQSRIGNDDDITPFFTAKYKEQEYLKFNNYRVLWKFGILYKLNNVSMGLNITSPSVNLYADTKSVMRKKSQSNITYPETHEAVPNYLVSDFAEKKNVAVNFKSPLSIAAGLTWENYNKTKTIYTTVEYFAGIDPYRMAEGEENFNISDAGSELDNFYDDWLTFVWGAKSVFNAGFGYKWIVKDNLLIMTGFRTDFNYRKDYNYLPLEQKRTLKGFQFDRYHLTGGVSSKVLGQDVMAGLQYTLGQQNNVKQFINLSDPVEYDPENRTALQGERQNSMTTVLNSISLYFGATFNFGGKKD
jgi:hypothetical protein